MLDTLDWKLVTFVHAMPTATAPDPRDSRLCAVLVAPPLSCLPDLRNETRALGHRFAHDLVDTHVFGTPDERALAKMRKQPAILLPTVALRPTLVHQDLRQLLAAHEDHLNSSILATMFPSYRCPCIDRSATSYYCEWHAGMPECWSRDRLRMLLCLHNPYLRSSM